MGALLQALLDAVFPAACAACDAPCAEEAGFCVECLRMLEPVAHPCAACGEPGRATQGLCPRCRTRAPPFARAFAPYLHFGPLARAIHRFKYEDHPELARPLAQRLHRSCTSFLAQAPAWVCAVPLHPSRLRARRYDQAALLARALASASGRPPPLSALTRIRATERQVGLSEAARARNVAEAFSASPAVRGLRVLLVDDVLTTGATARAAAQALRQAGAREVQVLALARAHRTD